MNITQEITTATAFVHLRNRFFRVVDQVSIETTVLVVIVKANATTAMPKVEAPTAAIT